jgi:glycosyltransferase involved in cell wall biosynthesis
MRVLITTDTIGGVWTYTRELAIGLLEAGCEVAIVSVGPLPSAEQQKWLQQLGQQWPNKTWFAGKECSLEWMQKNGDCYFNSEGFLLECVRYFNPDIFHSSQFCYGALPINIPKIVIAHSDIFSWWHSCRGGYPEDSEWLRNYISSVHRGIKGADIVIAPTKWMLEQVKAFYGPVKSTAVVFNGRKVSVFSNLSRKLQAITAGRLWDEAKNIQLLADIDTPFPLYAIGDCSFENEREGSRDTGQVHFLERIEEEALIQLFAQSSIYIITSCYEPFGLAAVEAALAGCAIVANDIPSLREVWGNAAVYFPCNNAAILSSILGWLAEDRRSLALAAKKANARAKTCFSREQMIEKYLGIYQQLLGTGVTCHAA